MDYTKKTDTLIFERVKGVIDMAEAKETDPLLEATEGAAIKALLRYESTRCCISRTPTNHRRAWPK